MSALVATYTARPQELDSAGLKLWQPPLPRIMQMAGLVDLAQMWNYVRAGLSAHVYQANSCPASIDADGVVTVPLDFYVFPTDMGLAYELQAHMGTISAQVAVTLPREFDLVFDQQSEHDLGYVCASVEVSFLSPAFDKYGRRVALPSVAVDGTMVKLSRPCFCVVRVKAQAQGYLHACTMRLQKYEEQEDEEGNINWTGYSVENLQNTIMATWMDRDELQSAELDLEIPPCVEDYLAACDDGELKGLVDIDPTKPVTLVYYSTCTGNILRVRTVRR